MDTKFIYLWENEKNSPTKLVYNFMRLELDVQNILRKKSWPTPKFNIVLLIYFDRVLRLKERHIPELEQKNSI